MRRCYVFFEFHLNLYNNVIMLYYIRFVCVVIGGMILQERRSKLFLKSQEHVLLPVSVAVWRLVISYAFGGMIGLCWCCTRLGVEETQEEFANR